MPLAWVTLFIPERERERERGGGERDRKRDREYCLCFQLYIIVRFLHFLSN